MFYDDDDARTTFNNDNTFKTEPKIYTYHLTN